MTAKEKELINKYAEAVKAGNNEKALVIAEEIRNIETTTNTVEKENKTMKTTKDYTLNGTINATNWKEFRAVMKEAGINTATKTYDQLAKEYLDKKATEHSEIVSTGDMTNDKVYPELQKEETEAPVKKPNYFTNLPDGLINRLIGELYSRKARFDSRGLIHMKDAYKAVCACVDHKGMMSVDEIRKYLNTMIKLGYLTFTNVNNNIKLFINFKTVVKDANGLVIGVVNK